MQNTICLLIHRPSPGFGFFSNFFFMLDQFEEADRIGAIPVVDMENHTTLYSEAGPLHGTRNAWEYYFEQPAGVGLMGMRGMDIVECGKLPPRFMGLVGRPPNRWSMKRGRALVRRHMKVKPHVLAEVDRLLPEGFHSDALGVHVRGGDMRAGAPGHPIPPAAAEYLRQARKLDAKHRFSRIVLACDEAETVEMFREAFGARLISGEAHRQSATDKNIQDFNRLFQASRENHRYLMGLEVLRDSLALSRCGTLLAGHSNVSLAARLFADPRQAFVEVRPVGVCTNEKTWWLQKWRALRYRVRNWA